MCKIFRNQLNLHSKSLARKLTTTGRCRIHCHTAIICCFVSDTVLFYGIWNWILRLLLLQEGIHLVAWNLILCCVGLFYVFTSSFFDTFLAKFARKLPPSFFVRNPGNTKMSEEVRDSWNKLHLNFANNFMTTSKSAFVLGLHFLRWFLGQRSTI